MEFSFVMCCGRVSCVVVWRHVVWCHVVWCGGVGYRAIGLALWFVEWWVGCLLDSDWYYVGLFGSLGCFKGLLLA